MMNNEKIVLLQCERANYKTMRSINITGFRPTDLKSDKTTAKIYPKAPKGCRSLEEFSDRLDEAILKKL